jgi:hypothetical protein
MNQRTIIFIAAMLISSVIIGDSIIYSSDRKASEQMPDAKEQTENRQAGKEKSKHRTIERNGKEFIIFETEPITVTIVNDKTCRECETSKIIPWLQGQLGATLALRRVEFDTVEGTDIIKEYDAQYLPYLLVGKEVEKKENLDHLTHHILTSIKDRYFLDFEKVGAKAGKYLWVTYYSKDDPRAPRLAFNKTEYDFGDVSLKDGVVKTEFTVKNSGKNPLQFVNMSTSCGCTSAQLKLPETTSPMYTMPGHGDPPAKWRGTLAPGESGTLTVHYDPSVHKDLVEQVTREIYVVSNDPATPKMKLKIHVNQIK